MYIHSTLCSSESLIWLTYAWQCLTQMQFINGYTHVRALEMRMIKNVATRWICDARLYNGAMYRYQSMQYSWQIVLYYAISVGACIASTDKDYCVSWTLCTTDSAKLSIFSYNYQFTKISFLVQCKQWQTHRALLCVGSIRAAMRVSCYDPASAYSMHVPWREDRLCQVLNIIMRV